MVRSQLLHLHSLGDFALIELKKEITYDGPIKNLSPPLGKEKGATKRIGKITSN